MTIAAISTANASGGVGIVRISGPDAVKIADKIYVGKPVSQMESHTIRLGKIQHNGKMLDQVLLSYFKAPNSYTGEDVVEINCHGGIYVCRMILEAVILNGARLAQAGEFTKRAFLNGKMDLSQAEAVADIISASGEDSVVVAANQLDRRLSDKINKARQELVDATGHLLATIDFSEEGVPDLSYDDLQEKIKNAVQTADELLKTADDGRIIKDGVNAAIVGAPNVGKSSLLNAMSGNDKAIVTDIAGTTRDVLESRVNVRGCVLNLLDTAGIRESDDLVEQMGISRSKDAIKNADIVFLVIDGSRELNDEDHQVIDLLDREKTICLINKSDLSQKAVVEGEYQKVFEISSATGEGLDDFFDYISNKYKVGDITQKAVITNQRHKNSLLTAKGLLKGILEAMDMDMPFDIILSDIELAISALGEISGMTVSDEIIDNIFENFCVGK